MSRDTFTYTHGDTGKKPSVAKDFQKNDRPQANNFDWFWYHTIEAVKGHASEFDRLDSNNDGIVDEADTLTAGGNLKGDLLAVNGEKVWNEAGGYVPQAQLQRDTVTVSTGTDLTGGGDVSLGESITINHEDTSTQSNVSAGSGAAITDVNLDGNGHVTSISTTPIAISDTHTAVSEGGVEMYGSVDDINFTGHLNVIDDTDGTITIDPAHNHDSRYYTQSEADGNFYNSWTIEEGDGEQTTIGSGEKLEIFGGKDMNTEITSTGSETRLDISHDNTTSQGNVDTAGATIVDSVSVDGNGHVSGMGTRNLSVTDLNGSGSIDAETLDSRDSDELVSTGFVLPMTKYPDKTDFEVWRLNCQSTEQLEIRRVDVGLKGGGSNSSISLDLYDVANNTSLVSDTNAGNVSRGKPIATSQSGATIIARLTNNTGSNQNITVTVKANIKE
jgi:hypothetical protein